MRDNKVQIKIEGENTRFDILKNMFVTIYNAEEGQISFILACYKERLKANEEFKKFADSDCPSKIKS